YGEAASGYSKAHLTDKDIHLEYDKEKEDHYGRTLAYVWLDKETLFNEELVRKGLAREKYYAPNGKYRDLFEKAEQEAKNNKEKIVRKRLDREKYYTPNSKYRELFEKAEQEAKNNKENIWS